MSAMYATAPPVSKTTFWSPLNVAALPAPSAEPKLVQPAQPPPATVVTMAAGTHGDADGETVPLGEVLTLHTAGKEPMLDNAMACSSAAAKL